VWGGTARRGQEDACESGSIVVLQAVMQRLAPAFRAAAVVSVSAALVSVLAEIYLCGVCSCQERLSRHGRGQPPPPLTTWVGSPRTPPMRWPW
jgi:hypothetical protein